MTIAQILHDAQMVTTLAQGFGAADPRIALALQVISGSLSLVQSLHAQGVFDPEEQTIEVNDIGQALLQNLKAQLAQLATSDAR